MREYIGKTCPFCKAAFVLGDEIVVCSDCEMPHHKDCWVENQGCTTFGCSGTIQNAGGDTSVTKDRMTYEESERVVFCTKCGARHTGSAAFCTKCGNRLTTAAAQTPAPPVFTQADPNNQNPYSYASYGNPAPQTDGELEQLIGVKQDYYLRVFHEMKTQDKKTSWNWAAFLVAPYWFVYRKLYVWGIGVMVLNLFISAIVEPGIALALWTGLWIAAGLFGNCIYMRQLEKHAAQARSMTEPYRSQYIRQNGGVSSGAVWIAIGAMTLVSLLL